MSVEKKVPEIRFKGFSGEWEEKALGKTRAYYTDGNYGEAYPSNSDLTDSNNGVPFLRGSNLSCGRLSKEGANYITKKKHSELTSGTLIEDDIVIAVRGSLGAVGYVKKENVGWNINSQLAIIRTDKDELAGIFLVQYLLSDVGQWKVLSKISGSALKQLPIGQLKSITVPIASIKEQIAIGNYFQKLDNLINQHQQKHDKLSNIKKAMLEKMFPKQGETMPEIRFKGFSGEWEEIELSDEVAFINGRAYSQEELLDKGKYTVLRVGNFYTNSSWYYSDLELGDKYYADNGDLLYTWSASFGPHIWNGDKVIYHYHIWKLALSENIDKLFLLHLLDYDRAKILSGSNGSTMIHITKSAMEAKKVFIPKKDEQIVIGNYFQKLDALINQHQQQIIKLNNIKQACLSKMFV